MNIVIIISYIEDMGFGLNCKERLGYESRKESGVYGK